MNASQQIDPDAAAPNGKPVDNNAVENPHTLQARYAVSDHTTAPPTARCGRARAKSKSQSTTTRLAAIKGKGGGVSKNPEEF